MLTCIPTLVQWEDGAPTRRIGELLYSAIVLLIHCIDSSSG